MPNNKLINTSCESRASNMNNERSSSSGFKHSVKVPTQYKAIAKILKVAQEKKKSIKNLVFEEKHARIHSLQAVLKHYSDNRGAIDDAIEKTGILKNNPRLDPELCKVLVTELIFGRKELKSNCRPVETVREYQEQLQEALSGVEVKKKVPKPRYVRVNTNLLSVAEALEFLATEEWQKKTTSADNYIDFLTAVNEIDEKEYLQDFHITGLLIFHPKWARYWAGHQYVLDKKFILQDKATCLAGELLQPSPGATVLDLCAAPGMKTLHMCNLMQNKGRIYAVEQSKERYTLLCKITGEAGCNIVSTIHGDALTVDAERCPDVEYILVDPSCSGNGMQMRSITVCDEQKDPERLKKLGGMQIKILSHAMSSFPQVKRIAYCTCSLWEEENEHVVQRCLQLNPQFKLLSCKKALRNKWKNVGSAEYKNIGKKCLYALPEFDYTDGIFLALFERRSNNGNDDD